MADEMGKQRLEDIQSSTKESMPQAKHCNF